VIKLQLIIYFLPVIGTVPSPLPNFGVAQEQILADDLTQLNKILFLSKIVQNRIELKTSRKILMNLGDYQQDLDNFS
jgi:hypothetical protein